MLSYKEKVPRARQARGLTQVQLEERCSTWRKVSVSTIGSIEARAGDQTVTTDRADLNVLYAIARALDLPPVYFITPDYREYMSARYHSLSGEELERFLALSTHGRVAWVVRDLALMWGNDGGFDVHEVVAQVPCLTTADLEQFLSGALPLAAEQLDALCKALGLPREALSPVDLRAPVEALSRYMSVLRLAVDLGVSPEKLAVKVGQTAVEERTGHQV